MSGEPTESGTTTGQLFADVTDAYSEMDMPASQYVLLVLVPSFVFFFVVVVGVLAVSLPTMVSVPSVLLGVLAVFAAVFYPRIVLSQRRQDMENSLHLAVTHMTVLSTTNINRMDVFRQLAEVDEYGALTEEMRRVVQLVDTWNQSLDDACRRRSREIPSEALADFLDRLSYSLGAGQELGDFLTSEHEALIRNYETIYEGSLDNLNVMKDLYLSMILAMTFGLVFSTVLPLLTGNNPMLIIAIVILLFLLVQLGFFVAIRSLTPHDPVWYYPDQRLFGSGRRIVASVAVGAVLTVGTTALAMGDLFGVGPQVLTAVYPGKEVPIAVYMAFSVTPFLVPGVVARYEERKVKARDEEFPSFIRALGATESAKQSTTSAVLEDLRRKDFGVLTDDIDGLYRRLNMRIEPRDAWDYFAAETQSYLIQKFSDMYLTGREMGGDPKELGELISQNMNVVLQLREKRRQETITLIGLLYGITAASSFAFFIGLEIVRVLAQMSLNISGANEAVGTKLINTGVYDIPAVEFLLVLIILFNAMLSSLMIRTVDGGHKVNSYAHFVLLTWLGTLVSVGTGVAVQTFLNVG